MSDLLEKPAVEERRIRTSARPDLADLVFLGWARISGAFVLVVMLGVGGYLALRATRALRTAGWSFLTVENWNPDGGHGQFGIAAVLIGTVLIGGVAVSLALPLALGSALYISEYAPRKLKRTLVGLVDLMAAVPSVVYGVWGFVLLQYKMTGIARWLASSDVACAAAWAGPGHGERTVLLDARDGEEQRVTELLWTEALRLARDGMTAEELAEELAGVREVKLDPRSVPYELGEAAGDLLLGGRYQQPDERLAALAAVTPGQARDAFSAALATALLVTPCGGGHNLGTADGRPLPRFHCTGDRAPADGRVFRPSLAARLLSGEARRARLTATDRGLWATGPGGTTHHIPFEEVVAVEMHGPGRLVYGRSTCFIPVMSELYREIGAAVRLIDSAVPERLRYTSSGFRTVDA
ncbi:hypothetical protein [Streptomyces sp. TLI_171]|uniref:hypothetical protein n=1 Tax=Streptomyces sp. TLI_171 TaxID=1938859 RepID=UPI000C1A1102|nr:hypothetical protein [Streptomyces sp. TLI_171]RKE19018.1 hypothetical protein BX266_2319 [Streptomyces sp. TLI_171]